MSRPQRKRFMSKRDSNGTLKKKYKKSTNAEEAKLDSYFDGLNDEDHDMLQNMIIGSGCKNLENSYIPEMTEAEYWEDELKLVDVPTVTISSEKIQPSTSKQDSVEMINVAPPVPGTTRQPQYSHKVDDDEVSTGKCNFPGESDCSFDYDRYNRVYDIETRQIYFYSNGKPFTLGQP